MVAMRSPIPVAIREQLQDDPFMSRCIFDNLQCGGRVEWHHAFTYAGKRQNEPWSLIPLCADFHHKEESRFRPFIKAVMQLRMSQFCEKDDFLAKYPKSDLFPAPIVKRGRPVKV